MSEQTRNYELTLRAQILQLLDDLPSNRIPIMFKSKVLGMAGRAAKLEAEVARQKQVAERAAIICQNCTGNPIEAFARVMAQAREEAAECSGPSE